MGKNDDGKNGHLLSFPQKVQKILVFLRKSCRFLKEFLNYCQTLLMEVIQCYPEIMWRYCRELVFPVRLYNKRHLTK